MDPQQYVAPVASAANAMFAALPGMAALPGGGQAIGGEGGMPSNLTMDQLNALIHFREQQLAAQQRQADAQNALAGRQMDQQGGQFGQQLSFNQQVQRAQEAANEKARVTNEMLGRGGLQNTQIGMQMQAEQARQQQAQASYGAYDASEIARRGQEINQTQFGATNELARRSQLAGEAMSKANLSASLRGPSNAFKQLEVNGLMNSSGLGSLSSILSGNERAPMFRAPGGTPEAATLGTLSRDMGENQAPGDWQQGIFRAPTSLAQDPNGGAGMRGMLGIGNQNASQEPPYDPNDPYWMAKREAIQNGEVMQRLGAQPGIGPGSSLGAELTQGLPGLIAANGGQVPSWDNSQLLQLYMTAAERNGTPISLAQAGVATRYASDFYRSYGRAMNEGELNDMVGGQVARGAAPDPSGWRPQPGGPPQLLPGMQPPPTGQTPGTAVGGPRYPDPGGMHGPQFAPGEQTQQLMGGGMQRGLIAPGGQEMMPGQQYQQQQGGAMVAPGQQYQQQQTAPGVNPISDAAASGGQMPNQAAGNQFLQFLSKTAPNKINAYSFNKLKKSAQDFTLGGYEALGYDRADTEQDIQRLLPTATGPKRGYVAPGGRAA